MAHQRTNIQVVEQLRSCCEHHRTARDLSFEAVDLAAVDLTGLQADSLRFADVDLREATLTDSQWVDCSFRDVRLDRIVAQRLIMRMCTLEGVRGTAADLRGAKLENTHAAGIALDRATLAGGSLVDSDLTRATLRDADLQNVDATGVILRGADLCGADLRGAVLAEADLRGADLRGAKLDGADMMGADLRGSLGLDGEEPPHAALPHVPPVVSPPYGALIDAIAPTIVDILQRGKHRGVLDEKAFAQMVKELGELGISNLDPDHSFLAAGSPLAQILTRVNEVGIGRLIAALGNANADEGPNRHPPPAVMELIRSLMGDVKLAPNATAEDLAVHLTKLMQSSLPRQDSNK